MLDTETDPRRLLLVWVHGYVLPPFALLKMRDSRQLDIPRAAVELMTADSKGTKAHSSHFPKVRTLDTRFVSRSGQPDMSQISQIRTRQNTRHGTSSMSSTRNTRRRANWHIAPRHLLSGWKSGLRSSASGKARQDLCNQVRAMLQESMVHMGRSCHRRTRRGTVRRPRGTFRNSPRLVSSSLGTRASSVSI